MDQEKNAGLNGEREKKYSFGIPFYLILLIGLITFGAQTFGYMEAQLLNTYIDHVLNLDLIFIAIMVSGSATMGLVFLFLWGVMSDNTRSEKYGMRRPFLLIGGVISGIGLILFGLSPNYFWCFFFDVLIIGIASNMYYAAQRVLIPDLVDIEYRGRVNGIVGIFSIFGILLPVALTLLANEFFTIPNPDPQETGTILTQEGHILLLSIGGIILIVIAIIGFLFLKNSAPASELPPKKSFKEEFKEMFNIEEFKEQKDFFRLILANTAFMCGIFVIMPYMFNFIFSLGLSNANLIVVLGVAAPFLLISIVLIGIFTDKFGRKKIIPPTILISCVGFLMIPSISEASELNIVLLSIAFSLILFGILGVVIPINTWSQDLLPEDKRGKFTGIYNIVNTVSQIVGSLTAGLFAMAIKGYVKNPIAWIFAIVPIFFIISIPLFMRVEETLFEKPTSQDLGDI